MMRPYIPFVLLVPLAAAAIGCTNDDKSKANPAAPAPTALQSKSPGTPGTPAARRADRVYAYVDSARHDLSDGKVTIINRVMQLSPEESAKFWPIYHDYEEELFALGDKRVEMTRAFVNAQSTQSFDNDRAAALAKDWFETESQQLELLKKYHDKIAAELSPVRAVQFTQIEHRVDTVIDLMIASELPLVRAEPARAAADAGK
jgi:hypothetical protein